MRKNFRCANWWSAAGFVLLAHLSAVLAQDYVGEWERVTLPDGTSVCVRPDYPDFHFVPDRYTSRRAISIVCRGGPSALEKILGVALPEAQAQISPAIAFDGTSYDSANRTGDPGSGALQSFTETAAGNVVLCDISDDNGATTPDTSYTGTASTGGEDVTAPSGDPGTCNALTTADLTSTDLSLRARISNTATHNNVDYAGAGAFICDDTGGDFGATGTCVSAWWPYGAGAVRCKWLEDGAFVDSAVGDLTATAPQYFLLQYDASETEVTCGEDPTAIGTGTDTDQIGTAWTISFAATVSYGYFWSSRDTGSNASYTLDNLSFGNTLYTYDGTSPDPTPDAGSDEEGDYADPVSGVTLAGQTPVAINANDLSTTDFACGNTYTVAAGTEADTWSLPDDCAATAPVVVIGAANWGTVVTAAVAQSGNYSVISGIKFQGGGKVTLTGINAKVVGNWFDGGSTGEYVYLPNTVNSPANDHSPEIAYNLVTQPAAGCTGDRRRFVWLQIATANDSSMVRNAWIHHNFVNGFTTTCEQGDLIDAGSGPAPAYIHNTCSGFWMEDNLIHGFGNTAPATHGVALDLKIGCAVIRRNTIRATVTNHGRLAQRHSFAGHFIRNYSDDNILTKNRDGIVACNVVDQIQVMAGNNDIGDQTPGHIRSQDWRIISNTANTLRIGYEYATWEFPALRTVVEDDNSTTIQCENEDLTDGACGDAANPTPTYTCDIAVALDDAEVGPAALQNAAAAYLAARGL